MNNIFNLLLLFVIVLVFFSCDNDQDAVLPDVTPPALTYLHINGEDVNDDTIHLSREEEFTFRFNFDDDVRVLEGEFSLIINNLEDLSKTIHKGPGQSNYKYTYGLLNLISINHLKSTNSYLVQPNDQIKFKVYAIDAANNFTERSITVIVF